MTVASGLVRSFAQLAVVRVLAAVVALTVRELPRGCAEVRKLETHPALFGEVLRFLIRRRTLMLIVLGTAMQPLSVLRHHHVGADVPRAYTTCPGAKSARASAGSSGSEVLWAPWPAAAWPIIRIGSTSAGTCGCRRRSCCSRSLSYSVLRYCRNPDNRLHASFRSASLVVGVPGGLASVLFWAASRWLEHDLAIFAGAGT
jgi:hypothetical protein